MIEFDVDMGYLLEEGELDCVVLNDENSEHEPIRFVRERTCQNLIEEVDWTDYHDFECSECHASMRQNGNAPGGVFNHCPSCGAKVVD